MPFGFGKDGPGFAAIMGERDLPPANASNVTSILSQREHKFSLPGTRGARKTTKLDDAATFGVPVQGEEGLYVDETCAQAKLGLIQQDIAKLIEQAAEAVSSPSLRKQILSKLTKAGDLINGPAVQKGALKHGKKIGGSGISIRNGQGKAKEKGTRTDSRC